MGRLSIGILRPSRHTDRSVPRGLLRVGGSEEPTEKLTRKMGVAFHLLGLLHKARVGHNFKPKASTLPASYDVAQ